MAICFYHPECESHDPGSDHSENVLRLHAIHEALISRLPANVHLKEMPLGEADIFKLAHDADYVDFVFNAIPKEGRKEIEINEVVSDHDGGEVTVLSPRSGDAILRCAGGIKASVDAVMSGNNVRAFCATRPPGHHALRNKAMGFCAFNNVAVAARYAQKAYSIGKIGIIDFDVHHGNGTQEIFAEDRNVIHACIHQLPLWPETGRESEVGCGNLLNVPVPPDSARDVWMSLWKDKIINRLDQEAPEIIFVSAGFDAHKLEPKAQQNLETEDYYTITQDIVRIAKKHAQGRIVSFLEGGYNVSALADSLLEHLRGLE